MQFIVVGNPGHRRVTMFDAALAAQGLPPAYVVAWVDIAARGPDAFADAPDAAILRIDSAGEDDAVERAFVRRGEAAARAEGAPTITADELARVPVELGRIIHPRQAHLGFLAALDDVTAAIRPDWKVVQPVAAIRDLFDKRVTSAQWAARGIPIPEPLLGVRDPDDLRARMREAGWRSVFVKIASSSSAAGLAIFTHSGDGEHAITTVEDTGRARYNTRKLQRVTARRALDRLLGFLLGEGAQVERAVPKARIAARTFDLRVLAIDGVAAFTVVRTSPHPITNLHLGGQRGDLDELRARIAPADWERAMATCVAVQRASGAFHVGVDLLFEPDLATHRVIEGNAFGDLLNGHDTYGWQIARLRGTV